MSETPGQAWARCAPYIEAALRHCGETHALEDVGSGVERGEFQFWPGQRSAAITEVLQAPRMKTLNLWLMGGELKELRALYPSIEAFARAIGCGRVTGGAVFGRLGWGRALGVAFAPRWTIYARELTP